MLKSRMLESNIDENGASKQTKCVRAWCNSKRIQLKKMWRKKEWEEKGKRKKIGLGKTSALYEFPLRVFMLFSSNLYYFFVHKPESHRQPA